MVELKIQSKTATRLIFDNRESHKAVGLLALTKNEWVNDEVTLQWKARLTRSNVTVKVAFKIE